MNYSEFLKTLTLDWKAKRSDWAVQDSMLILSVLRCAFELEKRTEEVFSQFDLNTATFGVLATLYRSSPKEGMTPTELGQHVLVSPGSITNRIDRLVDRELVVRESHSGDRRSQRVKLTKEGLRLFEKVMPLHLANEAKLLKKLTEADKKKLKELTLKLMEDYDV